MTESHDDQIDIDGLKLEVERLRADLARAIDRHKRDSALRDQHERALTEEIAMLAHVVASQDCGPLLEKLVTVTADRNRLLAELSKRSPYD